MFFLFTRKNDTQHSIKIFYKIFFISLLIFTTAFAIEKQDSEYLTMRGAISRALAKNNQIKASYYNFKKAQWDRMQAWTQLFPTATFNTRYMHIDNQTYIERDFRRYLPPELQASMPQTVFQKTYNTNIEFSVPLFNGVLLNGLLIANANKNAMEEINKSTKNNIIFQVISSYLNVLRSKQLLILHKEFLKLSKLNYEKAERKFSAGRFSKTEALRWKIDYQQQLSTFTTTKSNLRLSYAILSRMLNMDLKKDITVEKKIPQILLDELDKVKKTSDDEILKMIDISESELSAVNHALSAVQSQSKVSKLLYRNTFASFMPNVNLTYIHGWRENNTIELDDYSPKTLLINFSLPLFSSFQNFTKTKSSYYEYKKNKETYYDQLKNTRFILTQTANKIINLKVQCELSAYNIEYAKNNYRMVEKKHEQGLISNIDFIDAKLNFQNAELQNISNQYNLISATVEMYYLLGKLEHLFEN